MTTPPLRSYCKLQIANCKSRIETAGVSCQFAICNLQFAICNRSGLAWSLVAVHGMLSGCVTSGLDSNATPVKRFVKATPNNPAVKCLCVWQTADGFDSEGKSCRGVAGQVFFFNQGNAIPVVVDGDVRVFVFDNHGSEADQAKPLSQFDIDRQTWNTQLTRTQFGPAYRLFVPYTRPGRNQAELALRLRMTPDNGPTVFSDLSTITLAGHKPQKSEKADESAVTTQVEQALRDRLSGAELHNSRTDVPLVDARSKVADRSSSQTIATIRGTSRTED